MPIVYSAKDSNGFRLRIDYTTTTPNASSTLTSPRSTVSGTMYLESTVSGEYFSNWTLTTWLNIWGSGATTDTYPINKNQQFSIANPSSGTTRVSLGTFSKTIYHDTSDGTGYFYLYAYVDADTNAGYVPANIYYGPEYFALTTLPVTPPTPSYTVTYSNQYGSNGTTSQSVLEGSSGTFPDPGSRSNYTFAGWDYSYSAGTSTPSIYSNTTYTAQWTPLQWTVSYSGNGGSVGTSSDSVSRGSGLYLTSASRSGYSFNGWYTSSSGGSYVGGNGSYYVPSSDIALYAQWTLLAPGFTDESVANTLVINQNINSTGNSSVSATNTASYSIQYVSGLNATAWLSINNSGQLSGSTSTAGSYTFRIGATSSTGTTTYSNNITITVVYPGKRINSSLGQSQFTTAQRYTGTQWTPLTIMRRWNGSSWIDLTN